MDIIKRYTLNSIKNTELVFRRFVIPSQIKYLKCFTESAVLMYSDRLLDSLLV